jgi:hypothetical protein
VEHRDQIEAIVVEAVRRWGDGYWQGRHGFARAWAEVRQQLRGLRDTATSLVEDERTALQLLRRLQVTTRTQAAEPTAD